jgi:hypothetical protein
MEIQEVSLDRLMACKRKLRKNDRAVTRMAAAIKEFGFKIPVLARHCGEEIEVVDGDLRIKGAKKLRMTVVLAQVHGGRVHVLEEMILPDSNTLAACEELLNRTQKWNTGSPLEIYVYGDATGEQRRTSASRTDWQIAKDFFGRYPDRFRATFRVPSANPLVKDRVNLVNARLRNHAGQHHLRVDQNCKALIKDLEQVCWKTDPHGNPLVELDKSDPMRTHVSDALGYMVAWEFPMRPLRGEMPGPSIV